MRLPISVLAVWLIGSAAFAGETNYQSPVDGYSYRAEWHTYYPSNSAVTNVPTGRVEKQEIRLLSTQEEFGRNVDVAALADFIRKTEASINSSLGDATNVFELMVQTTLTKGKRPAFEMASKGDAPDEVLKRINAGYQKLPDLRSRKDELKFEVRFTVGKR